MICIGLGCAGQVKQVVDEEADTVTYSVDWFYAVETVLAHGKDDGLCTVKSIPVDSTAV